MLEKLRHADLSIIPDKNNPSLYIIDTWCVWRWLRVGKMGINELLNYLKQEGYKQIISTTPEWPFFPYWHYRLIKPDWETFKEWLRVEYNERESKVGYQWAVEKDQDKARAFRIEQKAYQTIVSNLILSSDYEELRADIEAWMMEEEVGEEEAKYYAEFIERLDDFIQNGNTGY